MDNKKQYNKENSAINMSVFPKSSQWYSILLRTSVLVLFWWMLNGNDHASWIIGVPSIAAAVSLSIILAPPRKLRWHPWQLIRFIRLFLYESFKGGIDVTSRVLHPTMPLHPIMFTYRVSLPVGLPRLLMLNVVSLLPGTLSADMQEDQLTLHILDKHTAFEAELQRIEKHIADMIAPVSETKA